MKRHFLALLAVILLSYWAVVPLIGPGYFPMHDDTQVGRVVAMGRALSSGQFPVRWVSDLGYGYGYPLFNFYGPLPYYFGGLLYVMGLSGLVATKMMMAAGIIFAALTSYFLASWYWGRLAGILAATFLTYAPYHAVQIYVRGAVGEYWILVFLPLLLWGLLESRDKRNWKSACAVGGLGLAGTILSHTVLGYVTTLFLFIGFIGYWLAHLARKHFNLSLFLIGLGLSAFFWLPAAVEMRYTSVISQIGPTANFRDHFVCLSQLWNSVWGFGGSAPGCLDGMSFKLGKLQLIASFLGVLVWLRSRRKLRRERLFMGMAVGILLSAIFLALPVSSFIWETIPGMKFAQYPWRFLTYTSLGMALLAPLVLVPFKKTIRLAITVGLVLAVISVNAKWFEPQFIYEREPAAFATAEELHFRVSKISDEYLPPELPRPQTLEELPRDTIHARPGVNLWVEYESETYGRYLLESNKSEKIIVNRAAFPGWRVKLDGNLMKWQADSGLISVSIPEGKSRLEIQFGDTKIREFANLISLVTIVILLALFYGEKAIR